MTTKAETKKLHRGHILQKLEKVDREVQLCLEIAAQLGSRTGRRLEKIRRNIAKASKELEAETAKRKTLMEHAREQLRKYDSGGDDPEE